MRGAVVSCFDVLEEQGPVLLWAAPAVFPLEAVCMLVSNCMRMHVDDVQSCTSMHLDDVQDVCMSQVPECVALPLEAACMFEMVYMYAYRMKRSTDLYTKMVLSHKRLEHARGESIFGAYVTS